MVWRLFLVLGSPSDAASADEQTNPRAANGSLEGQPVDHSGATNWSVKHSHSRTIHLPVTGYFTVAQTAGHAEIEKSKSLQRSNFHVVLSILSSDTAAETRQEDLA